MRSVRHSDRLHISAFFYLRHSDKPSPHMFEKERSFSMKEQTTSCTSVFKNGATPDEKGYTQIWIALINQMERSKAVLAGIEK